MKIAGAHSARAPLKQRTGRLSAWDRMTRAKRNVLCSARVAPALALVLAVFLAAACSHSTSTNPPPSPPQTFTLSGTLTPASAGAGATVALSGAGSATTTADSSGSYSFGGLAPGTYTITPSKSGFTFNPASQSLTVSGSNVTGVTFTAAAQVQTFTISGTISGGVGATVTLAGAANATTTADSSGSFSFSSLANGNYTITPSKPGLSFTPASLTATINGANITGANFTAAALTFSISGTISGGAGATVTLAGAASATATADGSGNFSFSSLANGGYTITPSKPGFSFTPASLTEAVNGANITGANFTATALTFGISGTISPTTGGGGATVTLNGAATASTTANSSGAYSFAGLANGTYTVTPSNSGYSFSPLNQAVTINGASITGVNFMASPVPPTYAISGTISPATIGSGALMTLSGAASGTTTVNSSGNYSFTGLGNGSYTVTPSSPSATFSPTNQAVTINNGNVAGVNFTATSTSNVFFFDDFTGTSLDTTKWTIIQRHGEYAQSETECNTAQQVSVANSQLTITTAVGPATCGDINHAPQSWPYVTGDVQWTSLNFTYGTIEVRAQFPPQSTGVWPAIWMLGQNCQQTNIQTGDTNIGTCPAPGSSGYQEIDIVECDPGGPWCHVVTYNGSVNAETEVCRFGVDTNWHVYTMVWASGSLSLSMDGQPVPGCSVTGSAVPSNPMFLLLQTQTSDFSVFGPPNNALLPTTFNIDYVKVTQP